MKTPHAPLTLCEFVDAGFPGVESFSPFCLKAHRALHLAGLPYTRRHGEHPGVFKAINPLGQLPILLVGDEAVYDSTAIVKRIDTLAPGSMSGPGDASSRAEAWLWEDYADTALNGFLVASRWADDRNWPTVKLTYFARMPGLIRAIVPGRLRAGILKSLVARDVWRAGAERCWARFEDLLDQLDTRAPREGFWVGEHATVADVSLFGQLQSFRTPLTPWQRGQVEQRASLTRYLDRVHARTRGAEVEATKQAA